MGEYDTLSCHRFLPDGCAERHFQIQSLGCAPNTYCLSADGRLLHDDGSDTAFHGVSRFYTHGATGQWHECEAKFTDGALQHLVSAEEATRDPHGIHLPPPLAQP